MRKLYIFLGLLAIASFVLAACAPAAGGKPSTGGFASADPTTFTEVTIGDILSLDPALLYDTASGEVVQSVYETLIFYDGENTDKFVPQLAESWEVSDDGTVYTFNIRTGVTFHEGGEMTPSDVAYSFQRGLLQGGYASPQWLLSEPFFGPGNDDISLVVQPRVAQQITDMIVAGEDLTGLPLGVDEIAGSEEGGPTALEEALAEVDTTDAEAVLAAVSGVVPQPADDRELMATAGADNLVAACEQVKAAIVADDAAGTVTMTLAGPWGPFFPTIAQTWGSVMDKEWVVENGGWDGSCDTWQNFYAMTDEENPFTGIANGTGAFKLDHWTPGEEVVLARNDAYWREPAKLERVVIQGIDEFGTRFAMLQAGDADWAYVDRANSPQVDPLAGEVCIWNADTVSSDCTVVDDSLPLRMAKGRPGLVEDVIIYNFGIAAEGNPYVGSGALDGNGIPADFFNDVHIRKGFSYAFDYDTYLADVFLGEAVQPFSLPLPGMPGYDASAAHYSYDLDAATAEFKLADLDQDGIAAGDDPEGDVWTTGFRVQMMYNLGNTSRQNVAEILAAGLSSVNELFSVEVLGLPWPSYLAAQRAHQIPIMTAGWQEDIHDPHNWYQPYTTGAYGSRQGMPDDLKDQFRVLLEAGVSETDPAARHQIYLEFNQLYYDLVPGVPIANPLGHSFRQRWVQGFVSNPLFSGIYFYPISKD